MNRLKVIAVLVGVVVAVVLVWLAFRAWGLWAIFAPIAVTGVAVNRVAKAIGARKITGNPEQPRRPSALTADEAPVIVDGKETRSSPRRDSFN